MLLVYSYFNYIVWIYIFPMTFTSFKLFLLLILSIRSFIMRPEKMWFGVHSVKIKTFKVVPFPTSVFVVLLIFFSFIKSSAVTKNHLSCLCISCWYLWTHSLSVWRPQSSSLQVSEPSLLFLFILTFLQWSLRSIPSGTFLETWRNEDLSSRLWGSF